MRKNKEKPTVETPDDLPVEIACENCCFWDTAEPNGNEALFDPHKPHTEFACKYLPQIVYKKVNDWCAQFQADASKAEAT